MRLHEFERRVLATAGIAVVLVVLLFVPAWMWALVRMEDDAAPAGLVALAFAPAVVILVSSWPVLHVAIAVARGGGSRPRRPGVWVAVFVVAVVVWGGALLWPLIFFGWGLFWGGLLLLALLVARRLAVAALRRARG